MQTMRRVNLDDIEEFGCIGTSHTGEDEESSEHDSDRSKLVRTSGFDERCEVTTPTLDGVRLRGDD